MLNAQEVKNSKKLFPENFRACKGPKFFRITFQLTQLVGRYQYGITLSDHAGIKELQIASKPNKFDVLNHYYGK